MSPQPATATKAAPVKTVKTPKTDAEKARDKAAQEAAFKLATELRTKIEAVPEAERTMAEVQFLRANELEKERDGILKRINANREFLRLMERNEALDGDDDLAEWLDDFYAEKEKGQRRSSDEVARTKGSKAAARGEKMGDTDADDDDDDDENES